MAMESVKRIEDNSMYNINTSWNPISWIIGFFVLILGTIFFRYDNGKFDKAATNWAYNPTAPIGKRFSLGDEWPWKFWNEYNREFAYLLIIIVLLMFLLAAIKKDKFSFLRKYAWFIFFTVILGAGLLVNNVFKAYWGRPRPRMTTLWPDVESPIGRYYLVWEPAFLDDPSLIGEGVSFPSGHVALMAAYIVFFYVFNHPKVWANVTGLPEKLFIALKWGSLIFVIFGGTMTAIGRIAAGAHHISDTFWSFGIVVPFTGLMYHLFKIPEYELFLLKK